MWGSYFNDEALLEPYMGDSFGFSDEEYGRGYVIKCVVFHKYRLIRRPGGVDVESEVTYQTRHNIRPRDVIDGLEVLGVSVVNDIFGKYQYTEAYV